MGSIVSALGSVVLLVSLWRPWYDLRFPDEVLQQARAFSSRMGELGPFAQQGIDQLQAQGSVPLTAWQVFEQADAALAVCGGLVLGLVVLEAMDALSSRMDGLITLAGVVATAIVLYRLASPPGGDIPMAADLLHPASGIYAALGGAVTMAVGGIMAMGRTAPAPASPMPETAPPIPAGEFKVWDAS